MEDPLEFPCRQGSGTRVIQATLQPSTCFECSPLALSSPVFAKWATTRCSHPTLSLQIWLDLSAWRRLASWPMEAAMRRHIVVLLALRSEPTMRANHRCGSALCASKPRRQRPRVDLQHMARPEEYYYLQHSRPRGHRLRQQSRRFCRCKSKAWASNTYPLPRRSSHAIDVYRSTRMECGMRTSNLACGHGAQCSGRFERSWSVQAECALTRPMMPPSISDAMPYPLHLHIPTPHHCHAATCTISCLSALHPCIKTE